MISLDMWRKYFKKAFRTYIDIAHQFNIPVMYHSCGDVKQFIPDFIECGLDISSPSNRKPPTWISRN